MQLPLKLIFLKSGKYTQGEKDSHTYYSHTSSSSLYEDLAYYLHAALGTPKSQSHASAGNPFLDTTWEKWDSWAEVLVYLQ